MNDFTKFVSPLTAGIRYRKVQTPFSPATWIFADCDDKDGSAKSYAFRLTVTNWSLRELL